MNQEKIGLFIAQLRKEKNLTQEQLAEKLGITNKSVSRWENGKNMPDYSILKDLCEILDIEVNELLRGERLKNIQNNDNLDMVLKEYYKMKKEKEKLKKIIIIGTIALVHVIVIALTLFIIINGYNNRLHVTTNKNEYENVIGENAKKQYKNKWGMNEEIFPKKINNLNVLDFKMICEDFIDNQFLSYLVVDYNEEDYEKEIKRLQNIGIKEYKNYYNVTGFTKYQLLAMDANDYQGFVYAITDGKSKIIYVELIFCNYTMDIDYKNEIPNEYLPDGFDATEENPYRKEKLNK